ncbi:MAG TPA: hypothetical protein VKB01_08175, partial [Thermomicrobiales bacterium]|nr:hypothetical protein [Thermomicrobiales bacterium]
LAAHPPGTPCLVPAAHRAGLDDCLDLLREAGEHIPSWLHQQRSIVRATNGAGGITGTVKLANLVADISRVLAWFDPESISPGQCVSAEYPQPGADAAPRTHGGLASSPINPDSTAPGVRKTPRAGVAACASEERWSRQGDQGGGGVNWKPTDEGHEVAAGEWTVGDRVKARANTIRVRTGSPGTVTGFSTVGGHPLVDFAGSGLVLIRAEHLERDGDAPPEAKPPGGSRSSSTTRLSDTPRPPAVAAALPPPLPDWFDLPPRLRADENHTSTLDPLDEKIAPSGLPSP